MTSWAQTQQPYCFAGIDERQDDFLDGECYKLNSLGDVERLVEELVLAGMATQLEDAAGDMEDDQIGKDHDEGDAKDSLVLNDEV